MRRTLALAAALLVGAAAGASAQSYHVVRTDSLGGDGGWDYLALDTVGHRLFIARQDRVMVVDQVSGRLLGQIPGLDRAHGVAFAYREGHGFATSGGDSTVLMFDLRTLAVQRRTLAAVDDDGILYDPPSNRVFTFNGDANSATAIDPSTGAKVGTVPLGGKPEFGVTDQAGHLFVNIADKGQIAEIDARRLRVVRRWPLAPCTEPTGLAIDRAHQRLFSGCRSGVMAISDARRGRLITTLPIGQGVDAARFDAATQLAFASCGDGTITVVHEDDPGHFRVVQTAQTKRGARTMELDERTHQLYTVTADFGPAPPPAPGRRFSRPPVLLGTFALLTLQR